MSPAQQPDADGPAGPTRPTGAPDLAALDAVGPTTSHHEAERLLREAGWAPCGSGDWAIALASPDGALAARISPFDPVGPYTARLYAEAAPTGAVPRLERHLRLSGGADLQVMELLQPVGAEEASAFLERVHRGDGDLAALAAIVRTVHAAARAELAWCGPLDTNPSNVMRGSDGRLVLIDPFYADGPALYGMAHEDPDRFVTTLPPEQRRHLTEIPLAESGPWPEAEREALRTRLAAADRARPAEALLAEAASADVDGWGFDWLVDRATEERPPWAFHRLLAAAVAEAHVAVDLDTGGGEVLGGCPRLAREQHVTESWPPNAELARSRLGPRGAHVHETAFGAPIPLPDGAADLVTSRHPIDPAWGEIARVLAPGGEYLAQHVGPGSAFALIEEFSGPTTPEQRRGRHPEDEAAAAEAAGLEVLELREARLRMEYSDIEAIAWILRKCPWWVPGFTVEGHRGTLLALDRRIRAEGPFVAHSTRHLIRARKR
ncbi:methyltransferase domain-containing protein [Brachybacterium sp. J144]|uniref:methyltransferase domain-containing protein n=1 Tax=Brachybacterium sp. J144 TaxID=3116487 RepID=UPI002E78140F|nr:methyltransferase domain-containing protein [Brachybacterium sp. J144]MEE1650125.1 methyltransferase domain-containing protein [Brachybacterium sp. J144]